MGGLLIADAAKEIVANTREGDVLWPNIVGIMGEYEYCGSLFALRYLLLCAWLICSFRYTCEQA